MNPPLNSKPMTISDYLLAHLNKYSSHLCWPCYPDPNPKFQFVSTACSTLKIHGIMMLPVLSVGHTAHFLTTFAKLFPLVGSVAINADRLIDIFFPHAFTYIIAVHRRIVIATLANQLCAKLASIVFGQVPTFPLLGLIQPAGHLRNARQRQGTVPLSGIQRAD